MGQTASVITITDTQTRSEAGKSLCQQGTQCASMRFGALISISEISKKKFSKESYGSIAAITECNTLLLAVAQLQAPCERPSTATALPHRHMDRHIVQTL